MEEWLLNVGVVNPGVFARAGLAFQYLGAQFNQHLDRAMQQELADMVLKKAKQMVPVRTGALRASGRTAVTPDRKGVEVRFGDSRVAYARVVEFGRVAFAPFPARPYLRPAVAMVANKAPAHVRKKVQKTLKQNMPRRFE